MVSSDTPENLELLMSGAGRIEIEARASASQMKQILNTTGKIREASYKTSASGITTAQIETKDQEDIREELFLAFAKSGLPLLTLKQNKSTLEEIFLELTQGSGGKINKSKKKQKEEEQEQKSVTEGGKADESNI